MSHELALSSFPIITPADILDWSSGAADLSPRALELVARSVSDGIEEFLQRKLLARDYTLERYDGTGEPFLSLRNAPVNSIAEIRFRGVALTAAELAEVDIVRPGDPEDISGRLYRSSGWSARPLWDRPRRQALKDPISSDTEWYDTGGLDTSGVWEISYNGGLTAVPATIMHVALEMADHAIQYKAAGLKQSETLGDYSYTLQPASLQSMDSGGPQARWASALARYQRVAWR